MSNGRKVFITTPIYYVNDSPHIGHAYTTVLGDVLARYYRVFGYDAFLLAGTDEHGQKVERAAKQKGHTPKEHCDEYVKRFLDLWSRLGIQYSDFIRTTEPRHTAIVEKVLADLFQKGEIYKAKYSGWYCTPCERFFTEKDFSGLECPDCNRELERIEEENYFFRMGKYQNWLIEHIQSHPGFIQPDSRRNETLGFLKNPLSDLCISRPKRRLSWGIELPFDPEYVCYVWFDALLNYLSAVGYLANNENFDRWWPADYHLIGKDILTTHTVYWPTMLKAIGIEQPRTVFAHGWWLTAGGKMSKSKGNVVNPLVLLDKYGVDAFRYFLLSEMTVGQDSAFSEERFIIRCNSDLANNFGNLVNRVLKLILDSFGGVIPASAEVQAVDNELQSTILQIAGSVENEVRAMRIDSVLGLLFSGCSSTNQYLEKTEPWKLKRNPEQRDRLGTVLYYSLEALRVISGFLWPVIPGKAHLLRVSIGADDRDGVPEAEALLQWGITKAGTPIRDTGSLFPRI